MLSQSQCKKRNYMAGLTFVPSVCPLCTNRVNPLSNYSSVSEYYRVINPVTEHWESTWHHHLLFLHTHTHTHTHTPLIHVHVSSNSSSCGGQSQLGGGVPGHTCVRGGGQSGDPGVRSHHTWHVHMELHQARDWGYKSCGVQFGERNEDPEAGRDAWTADGHLKQCICKHRETASGRTRPVYLPGLLWHRQRSQSVLLLCAPHCPR